jgi:hypothetical protein
MKKWLWIAMVAVLMGSVFAASAQEVMSANAIGYIKRELPPGGKLVTVSIPLFNMSAPNNVFSNLSLSAEAPALSVVSFWDANDQQWVGGTKNAKTGWPANVVTQIVASGDFFFLKGPLAAVTPTEITITGELPNDASLARAIPGGGLLGSLANPYPADFVFGTSPLAANASALSVVSFWDANDQQWVGGTKNAKTGWPANVVTQKVMATAGFFLKEAGSVNSWDVTKPYTWP